MMKWKWPWARHRIRSLYVKWILLFTGIIVVAQITALLFSFKYVIPDFVTKTEDRLYHKALLLRQLYEQGFPLTDDIFNTIGDTDIQFANITSGGVSGEIEGYMDKISLDMLERAKTGEIVPGDKARHPMMPFYLVALGDQIGFIAPRIQGSAVNMVVLGIEKSIILSAVLSSVLIVVALGIIIRPIKKVSRATKLVARGDFDIQLDTKSIDEVGQLIENFNRMTAALKKNEYLRKDFVSSVSHEFKTPITSIEGFARLLKSQDLTPGQMEEYTDIIIKETGRLTNLSSNLLKLSMLDNNSLKSVKTVFFLDEQIRNVILLLENQWADKELELNIELEEISFWGNEELLFQVWLNVIQNAVKFSDMGKSIDITAQNMGAQIEVTVRDYGIGISEESQAHIFDRFYKADASRSKSGYGLGLSIAKRIIEIEHGSITVESAKGRGTVFTIRLPNERRLPPSG